MLGMLISPNFGEGPEGVPLWWYTFGGVREVVSGLLQAIYTKPLGICCGFAAVLKLNFGIPNLGEQGPYGLAFVVSDGASVTSDRLHYKALKCLLW